MTGEASRPAGHAGPADGAGHAGQADEAQAAAAPGRWRIQIDGGAEFSLAADEDSLLRGALRAGVPWPYECSVGGCGACRFDLVEGLMETLWEAAPGLSERDRKRGKRLACQSRPLGDGRVKVRLDAPVSGHAPPVPVRRQVTLLARRRVTPDMDEFSFQLPEGDAGEFIAGQYALLEPPGLGAPRAYSMANLPGERNGAQAVWCFVIRQVPGGAGSGALFGLAPGAQIAIDGPFGHGHLQPGTRDVVCIAGGSGLGPMLSVARGVLAEAGTRRVHFFLGLRTQAELGAVRELDGLDPVRLRLHTVLSSPSALAPWVGPTGFVHEETERALAQPLAQHDFYFAGPPRMVEAVQEMLMVRHRVPFGQVHFDRFV